MPKYESKYRGKKMGEDISEIDLMRDLNEFYGKVTPVIKQILNGKHVRTSKAVYRLKLEK
jgi:hypothetical protein